MNLRAGTAVRDLIPRQPIFLAGYPHVQRISTGVHDPLSASALFLSDGATQVMFIAVDTLFVPADSVNLCRAAIAEATGVPAANILISATHTHSGPLTTSVLAWKDDPVVPLPDGAYLDQFHRGIIESAVAAWRAAEPARLAVASATADGVGCNRLEPNGAFDAEVGLLAIQRERDRQLMASVLIYGMHPTVLHEDSRLVSSDFPHFTRARLREVFPNLTTLYHLGPCGNLSPRYHVKAQTFGEAERLGRRLGESVLRQLEALTDADFRSDIRLAAANDRVELIPNTFLPVAEAEANLRNARERFEQLKREGAAHGPVRTAECVVFGCEEALTLARAQASGEVAKWQEQYSLAEVQVFCIGDLFIASLPGEQFVEYGLEIKRRAPGRAFVISLANGELQGYIVTPAAAAAGGYEAAFALFRAESGARLVNSAVKLMQGLRP
jgi:neutral ceramidase